MPELDVSLVLTSPYLVDFFNVTRRQEIIGQNGRNSFVALPFSNITGVVTPGKNNSLRREEDQQTQGKSLVISTRFMLRGASQDNSGAYQPDLVSWGGNSFVVNECRDNSRYGQGFIKAHCEMTDMISQPSTAGLTFPGATPMAVLTPYIPTVVSSTVVTLPATINPNGLLLFRNGVLNTIQNKDFTTQVVNGLLQLNLTIPLGSGDFLVAFA